MDNSFHRGFGGRNTWTYRPDYSNGYPTKIYPSYSQWNKGPYNLSELPEPIPDYDDDPAPDYDLSKSEDKWQKKAPKISKQAQKDSRKSHQIAHSERRTTTSALEFELSTEPIMKSKDFARRMEALQTFWTSPDNLKPYEPPPDYYDSDDEAQKRLENLSKASKKSEVKQKVPDTNKRYSGFYSMQWASESNLASRSPPSLHHHEFDGGHLKNEKQSKKSKGERQSSQKSKGKSKSQQKHESGSPNANKNTKESRKSQSSSKRKSAPPIDYQSASLLVREAQREQHRS